jgi:hypothetical protein
MDDHPTDTARARAPLRVLVPIAESAAGAYRAVFQRFGLLLDLAWLPLLVMLAATLGPGYLRLYLGWKGVPGWAGDAYGVRVEDLIGAVVGLLCLNAFAARWHQTMLFSRERGVRAGLFLGAWLRFVLYTLLLSFVSAAALAALLFADGQPSVAPYAAPAGGLLVTFIWVGMVRCCLLFPAAAYGSPLGLGAAWRAMRGNSWRLLGSMIIACAPALMLVIVILSAVSTALHLDQTPDSVPMGFFILAGLIETCANFVIVALGASVLSIFYRRIMLGGTLVGR